MRCLQNGDHFIFYDDYNEGPNGATYYYTYRTLGPWASDQLETVYIYSAAAGHRTVGDFTVAYEQFEYDDDGNMTKRTVAATGEEINYEWSDYNRLLKVTSTVNGVLQENKYDIDGIRDRKTDKNGNTAIEYPIGYMTTASRPRNASSNAPKISYIQGPNGFLGYEEDGQMRYFVLDALQSVTNIVDSSKNVVQSYQYDEWGNHMSGSGTGSVQSPKTYWGGLSVNDETADTGLYLAGHRFFDPKLGRFISRDPIGHSGGLNLYALGNNNPVNFVDPDGLEVAITHTNGSMQVFSEGKLGFVAPYLAGPHLPIESIVFSMHGSTTGMSDSSSGGRQQRLRASAKGVYFLLGDKRIFLDELLKDEDTLQRIELRGCNTAGLHPDREKFAERLRNEGNELTASAYMRADSNLTIAEALARQLPGVSVLGSVGPSFFRSGDVGTMRVTNPRTFLFNGSGSGRTWGSITHYDGTVENFNTRIP